MLEESVPHEGSVVPRHPDFITEISRVTGSRDVDIDTRDSPTRESKVFQSCDVRFSSLHQQTARRRALKSKRGNFVRDVFDLHVKPQTILVKPTHARISGRPAVAIFGEPRNRAVIDHLALLVAPAAVNDLADGNFIDVTRDHTVDEFRRFPS